MSDQIERISKVDGVGSKGLEHVQKVSPQDLDKGSVSNKDHFESLMAQERQKENLQVQRQSEPKQNSLIDEVRELSNKVDGWRIDVQPSDLIAQAKEASVKIDAIKEKLATPGLEINRPVQNLLKRKLSHIDENLKIALDRAGVEYKDVKPEELEGIANPIERFLGMLSDGQHRLNTLTTDIDNLDPKMINPKDLLTIQVKVNYVQQELEFFTNLLNKSLESTKTLMNVQV